MWVFHVESSAGGSRADRWSSAFLRRGSNTAGRRERLRGGRPPGTSYRGCRPLVLEVGNPFRPSGQRCHQRRARTQSRHCRRSISSSSWSRIFCPRFRPSDFRLARQGRPSSRRPLGRGSVGGARVVPLTRQQGGDPFAVRVSFKSRPVPRPESSHLHNRERVPKQANLFRGQRRLRRCSESEVYEKRGRS